MKLNEILGRDVMVSYAQTFEDVMLARAFRNQTEGFYVDIGAWHPSLDSVTKHFYDRGWHGVNVEPLPDNHQAIAAERPRDINLNVAISGTAHHVRLHRVKTTGLSTLLPDLATRHAGTGFEVDELEVPAISLKELCSSFVAQRQIDFLKIDVEGVEADVVASGDWRAYRPRIVLVEATLPTTMSESYSDWEPILLNHGYVYRYFDGLNRWYTREEEPTLGEHFKSPPNPFDCYVLAEVHQLRVEVEELTKRLRAAMAKADRYDRIGSTVVGKIAIRIDRFTHRSTASRTSNVPIRRSATHE